MVLETATVSDAYLAMREVLINNARACEGEVGC